MATWTHRVPGFASIATKHKLISVGQRKYPILRVAGHEGVFYYGTSQNSILAYDVASGVTKELGRMDGDGRVIGLSFCNGHLYSSDSTGTICIWDVRTAKAANTLRLSTKEGRGIVAMDVVQGP
jgi:WD40 repeat protein